MKRLSVFLVLTLVLSFGLANGQTAISLESVDGEFSPTQLATGQPVQFNIRVTNVPGENSNSTNGFRVFSPDGATWTPMTGNFANGIDGNISSSFINFFGNDGAGADTVGYALVGFKASEGLQAGFDAVGYQIQIGVLADADTNKTICIDSTWFPPGGVWAWSSLQNIGTTFIPTWSGQQCWTIFKVPDLPPDATGPNTYSFSHCDVGTIQYGFTDQDGCIAGGSVIPEWYIVSGPGTIDPSTGVWSWSGATVPQEDPGVVLEIGVRDLCSGGDGGGTQVTNISVTNLGPALTGGCGVSATVQSGNAFANQMSATDDCDILTWSVAGAAAGAFSIDAAGLFSYTPVDADEGVQVFNITVSDGILSATCPITITVIVGAPYTVRIEPGAGYNQTCNGFLQGQFAEMDIILEGVDPNEGIGGFDFVIAYDASALSFQSASEGDIYGLCNWEYFTYRYGPSGNCSGGCPSGKLRVIGIAETNDGAGSPTCTTADPAGPTSLAHLTFLVSNDRTLECQAIPIRFCWFDCGDNTISNLSGSQLYISSKVFDFGNASPINAEAVFPTFLGAPDACLIGDKVIPERKVDFTNGQIKICCADEIDARGDINLNGVTYEIADAVMLTNYFVDGLIAFGTHSAGSIAASDVNADGIALSVADLVYLIRVVVGDALPYPKDVVAVEANWYHEDNVINVNKDMGAAYIVVEGNVTPTLLANDMEMISRFDGENTKILVFNDEVAGATFDGNFLQVEGNVLSVEMATYQGIPVAAKNVPTSFALEGNYPNPFNPTTNIAFRLTEAVDYSISIYNVTGQVVETISGRGDIGTNTVVWDASRLASGIYFYKIVAGDNTATEKAVLLK